MSEKVPTGGYAVPQEVVRMIRRLTPPVGVMILATMVLLGCGGGELAETLVLLEECRTDKVAAQGATLACEDRYQREVRQWEDMDAVIADVLPRTLAEFRDDREEILELVPQEARDEVGLYIEELSDFMGRGFQVLREEGESTLLELEIAQTKLDALRATTDSIDERAESMNQTLEGGLRDTLAAQREMSRRAQDLVEKLRSFDELYIRDQSSDERLRLNRNQRETIAGFHAELMGDLAAIGALR